MTSVHNYLTILPERARALDGLRWSPAHAYLEHGDGRTFAHALEVFAFLEGFAGRRKLIHFGHVLHFLYLLRHGAVPTPWYDFAPLCRAWRAAGRPARTAGAFCALLCKDVPPVSVPPALQDLARWLAVLSRGTEEPGFGARGLPEEAPWSGEEFETHLRAALEGYSEEDLVHWFRHGQASPRRQAEDLARVLLANKPPALEKVLAELTRHERLAGAVPFVARLVSALTIPPRRLVDRELPLGGYADVTTRGMPEQILPAQFALDELEFLRRFAEHELLFYRREEPGSRTREDLVLLLDQGVRTWGSVRLVLAAAVLALGQLARRRKVPLLLAGTANGGKLIDPLRTPPDQLSELLAASDMTAHPGLALEKVLAERGDAPGGPPPRDVVLLTHPRNLNEEEVLAAARRVRAPLRLFAVAVDAHGEVHLHELRHGLPVTLCRIPIDLDAPAAEPAAHTTASGAPWQGDVERVPFPFQFGLASNRDRFLFAFDHAGAWLLGATQFGMLCATRTDGSGHEILPRARWGEKTLTDVEQVLGVSGGFVVVGRLPGSLLLAAHYDFQARSVKVYHWSHNAATGGALEWRYVRRQHLLVLRAGESFTGLHLPTRKQDVTVPDHLHWRAPKAETSAHHTIQPLPYQEGGIPDAPPAAWRHPFIVLEYPSRTVKLVDVVPGWETFTPLADGKPALEARGLVRGECRHDVLAVLFRASNTTKQVWLFGGPEGRTLTTIGVADERDAFALSPDGSLLAVQRAPCQVEVRSTRSPGAEVRCLSPVGRFHNNAVVELGERWLALVIQRKVHLARWDRGQLELLLREGNLRGVLGQEFADTGIAPEGTRALPGRIPSFLKDDPVRFRLAAWRNLIAVVDPYGEVFVFEQTGELVCAFFAFRQDLAAWMPDGTCLGAEALLGRPPTAGAARVMGRALHDAWERGETTIT
jgi:hypothetical protein